MDGTPAACAPRRVWLQSRHPARNVALLEPRPLHPALTCAACGLALHDQPDLVILIDAPDWGRTGLLLLCTGCLAARTTRPVPWGAWTPEAPSGLPSAPQGQGPPVPLPLARPRGRGAAA